MSRNKYTLMDLKEFAQKIKLLKFWNGNEIAVLQYRRDIFM